MCKTLFQSGGQIVPQIKLFMITQTDSAKSDKISKDPLVDIVNI